LKRLLSSFATITGSKGKEVAPDASYPDAPALPEAGGAGDAGGLGGDPSPPCRPDKRLAPRAK